MSRPTSPCARCSSRAPTRTWSLGERSTKMVTDRRTRRPSGEHVRWPWPRNRVRRLRPQGASIARAPAIGNDKPLPDPVLPDLRPSHGSMLGWPKARTPPTPRASPSRRASGGYDYMATSVETPPADWSWRMPLNEAAATLGQLAVIEAAVTCSCSCSWRCLRRGPWPRPAAARDASRNGSRIAAGDLGRRISRSTGDRGRAAGACAELDARPDRDGAGRPRGVRAASQASRHRRLARTAHAADGDPRLRRAVPARRRRAAGRPCRAMRGIESSPSGWPSSSTSCSSLPGWTRASRCLVDEDLVPVVRAAVDAARVIEPIDRWRCAFPRRPWSARTRRGCARSSTTC